METANPSGRFRAAPVRVIRGTTQDWVQVLGLGRSESTPIGLPAGAGTILDACRSFETLAEHVRRAGNQPGINELLAQFARTGLLIPESALVVGQPFFAAAAFQVATNGIPGTPTESIPPTLTSLSGITAGRAAPTLRCLHSFLDHNRGLGRAMPVHVFDDRSTGTEARHFRAALADLAMEHHVPAFYAALDDKRRFLEAAIQTGLSPSTTAFALLGPDKFTLPTTGANRNAFLLHTAGTAAFSADDDVVCRPDTSPQATAGIRLYSGFNPLNLWFLKNRGEAFHAHATAEPDLMGAHESLLGRPPRALAAVGISPRSSDFSHELFQTVLTGSGRVLATLTGLVGDSGFGTASTYLTMGGELRRRLLESPETYESALTSRTIRMVADQPTIAQSPFLMSYAFAVDGRELLPPFFPVCRNQDGIFGAVLNRLYPPGSIAHVPVSILHDPPVPRTMERDRVWRDASVISMSEIVIALVATFEPGPGQPPMDRLRALGRYLAALGRLPQPEFLDFVSWQLLQSASRRLARYQAALETHRGLPYYWAADCRSYIQTLTEGMRSPTWTVPADLPLGCPVQPLIRRYGELLIDWPDIVAVARRLRDSGHPLATPA